MTTVKIDLTPSFYVVGGTMRPDAPSYVERQADKELYDALARGEFCYVLTARQMGKSSLMIRTAMRLREAGIKVAVLDLTAVGQNLTVEQWYGGLLVQIGQRLSLEDEVIQFWASHPVLGPMQRWVQAIRTVVMSRYPGRLVIFIDEIDAVRSLPFSTDELFAGIRECYNQRSEDSEMQRITFCLLGVATPFDLIRDTRTTPFNIGRRVELKDFTEAEAAPLVSGLGRGEVQGSAILSRILHWTSGHPYLTQRLCLAVSEDESIQSDADIDRLCEGVFFSRRAQERDDNLLFVRERILRSEADLSGLLELYARVRSRKAVHDDEADPRVNILRLAGITRAEAGRLKVRNRIYEHVFDKAWVAANMPSAELRRQRAAFLRGVWRTAVVSFLIIGLIGWLAFMAVKQRNRAEQQSVINRRLLYLAQTRLAQQELDNANVDRVEDLLSSNMPQQEGEDLRGFEWHLLWQLTHNEVWRLKEENKVVNVGFLDDGNTLVISEALRAKGAGDDEYLIKIHDLKTKRDISSFSVPAGRNYDLVVFSPDRQLVAVDGPDKDVVVWNVRSGERVRIFNGHSKAITAIAFSHDGRHLASADFGGVIKLWSMETGGEERTVRGLGQWAVGIAFSPDGRLLATTDETRAVKVWDVATGRELKPFRVNEEILVRAAFLPDGKRFVVTAKDGRLYLMDVKTRQVIKALGGHSVEAKSIAFSTDGKVVATGSLDRTVKLWDMAQAQEPRTIRGHGSEITSVDWSIDDKSLVTGSLDGTIKIWDVATKTEPTLPAEPAAKYLATTFSSDNDLVAFGSDRNSRVKLWNLSTGEQLAKLNEAGSALLCAVFSQDRKLLATGGMDHLVKVWDVTTGRQIHALSGHAGNVLGVVFSPDGKLLISGGEDHALIIWDVESGQNLGAFNSGVDNYYRAVFSPDGRSVASACRDGSVKLWNVNTREIINTFVGHKDQVRAIAFSSDGRQLATGGKDNTVRLWDAATGKELKGPARSDYVQRVVFSADGKRLVTGGVDGSVKLWDVTTWQELMNLKGHAGEVTSVTFSEDGMSLATSSDDGTVRLWRAAATK